MTSANTLLAVITSITTIIIKLLKELWADRLLPASPFLNVKCTINKYFTNSTIADYSITIIQMVWIVSWHNIFFQHHKHTSIINLVPEVALVTKFK